jgi:predicted RND superfamily exporter protein
MLVAISLGVLVGLASLLAMAVLFLAAAAALVRFWRAAQEESEAAVVVTTVTREFSRPATLVQAHPRG